MWENVRYIQPNGRDGFSEKAGEKGECDDLKNGPLRYAEKNGKLIGINWHQLEIMMDSPDGAKVGA